MKKKGLLISTIVMVVVLIAALTTSTYAWFTTSSVVKVDSIDFAVKAGSDVIIGLSKTNSIKNSPTALDFWSGNTEYTYGDTFKDAGSWEGDFNGLAGEINLNNLTLENITKAVGTGTFTGTAGAYFNSSGDYVEGTVLAGTTDESFNGDNYKTGMIKAAGQGTYADPSTVDRAWKQYDYLDVVIGVQAAKSNLSDMYCYVTINPQTAAILGMNAAIHCAWEVVTQTGTETGLTTSSDHDVYGDSYSFSSDPGTVTNSTYNSVKTAYETAMSTESGGKYTSQGMECLGGEAKVNLSTGAITYAIPIDAGEGSSAISTSDIYQLHLVIFIAGYDKDCQESGKGVGSTIYITFAGSKLATSED